MKKLLIVIGVLAALFLADFAISRLLHQGIFFKQVMCEKVVFDSDADPKYSGGIVYINYYFFQARPTCWGEDLFTPPGGA